MAASTKQSFRRGEPAATADDQVYFKMAKFEDKMKNAEDRYIERQMEIVQKGQLRASFIA
jgi:hypothetical protein